jgi:plastocyanin
MHLRRRRHTIALAAALLAVTLGSTACGSSDGAGYGADGTSAAGGTSDGDAVSIAGFAFDPSSSSVSVGTTVTWTNTDGATHTVTADDGSFDSGKLGNGETFTHSFDAVGTFSYHCEIHSSMTGSIVVAA